MADDRPAESVTDAVTTMRREYDDRLSTLAARLDRRPVGTIEPALRTTAPVGALPLQGQILNRADYPDLWTWAQSVGAATGGLFTTGNGTTTFGLPDLRGRTLVGLGTLGADTYTLGATGGVSSVTLTAAQMPSHAHTATTGSNSHAHTLNSAGNHDGHVSQSSVGHESGPGGYGSHGHPPSWGETDGDHSHTVNSDAHTHTVTVDATAAGVAHENRAPYVVVNWIIWV